MNEYINIQEASELLKCSEYTVRKLCRENKLKAVKKLKRWYILKKSIEEYLLN